MININRSTNSQGIVETINTIVLKIIVLGNTNSERVLEGILSRY